MDVLCRLLTIGNRESSSTNNATNVCYVSLQLKPDSRLPFYILYDETLSPRPIRCHSFLFNVSHNVFLPWSTLIRENTLSLSHITCHKKTSFSSYKKLTFEFGIKTRFGSRPRTYTPVVFGHFNSLIIQTWSYDVWTTSVHSQDHLTFILPAKDYIETTKLWAIKDPLICLNVIIVWPWKRICYLLC